MERKILDQAKMERYSPVLYEAYEEFYEVDIHAGIMNQIFHTPGKYSDFKPERERYFEAAGKAHVHPHDRETFMSIFCPESLLEVTENGKKKTVEFRCRKAAGGFSWVRGVLIATRVCGPGIALFYIIDIENEKNADHLRQMNEGLLSAYFSIYQGLAELNVELMEAVILQYEPLPELVNCTFSLEGLKEYFSSRLLYIEDLEIFTRTFSMRRFLLLWQSGQKKISLNIRCRKEGDRFGWMEINAVLVGQGKILQKIYLTLRNAEEEHLLKNIVDRFVYGNCDYFIFLDGRQNSYMMFGGSDNGTPLPPVECNDYGAEVVNYARNFVVPEDQEMVISKMELSHVLEVLDRSGEYSFYCGVVDPVRGYTRKRLIYQYYDKLNQLILLIRTDVTSMFMEQKRQSHLLRTAQAQAQTDLLTGIFNQSVKEMIAERLTGCRERAALLFLDLDNFKTVNDNLGHGRGDQLLKDVASALEKVLRKEDLIGRVGGDEFVVLLEPAATEEHIRACTQRICMEVEQVLMQRTQNLSTGCSIGIALYPRDGEDVHTLMEKADRAAYAVKRKGKNGFMFASDLLEEEKNTF